MSILNVNQIQPVGSGQTVTISATNIDTGSATVTAGTFSGNLSSSGISTFSDTVNVGAGKSIRLYGATSGYSEIVAAAGSASTTFTLPANGGSASQYLQTDGAGVLSWQTITTGTVINSAVYTNSTRTSVTETAANTNRVTLWSFSYNKQSSTSNLYVFGTMPGSGSDSGSIAIETSYGTTTVTGGWGYTFDSSNTIKMAPIGVAITGHTTTGAQTLSFLFFAANSAVGNRPFVILNPNSSDEARNNQHTSYAVVLEVEP